MKTQTKIVILGAGYAGMMAALGLSGKTRKLNTEITLINGVDTFVERPRLHHATTGQTVPQKPIHNMLKGTRVKFWQGWVTVLNPDAHSVTVQTPKGDETIPYDILVYALGSVVDQDSVPGVWENAYVLDPRGANAARALYKQLQTLTGRVVVVGGGATRPVQGREAVARFLLVRDGAGQPVFVFSIEVREGKIDKAWIAANPEKLRGI